MPVLQVFVPILTVFFLLGCYISYGYNGVVRVLIFGSCTTMETLDAGFRILQPAPIANKLSRELHTQFFQYFASQGVDAVIGKAKH